MIQGTPTAALIRACEAADEAGHDLPMHVVQNIVDRVAEEIAMALQKRIPKESPDSVEWTDAARRGDWTR